MERAPLTTFVRLVTSTRQTLGLDAIEKRHWRIVACSAFTGEGLVDGMDWVVQDIASRIFMYD